MSNYKLSEEAKEDIIRIHHYGVERLGVRQPDEYFNGFFDYFELISRNPYSFESVNYIREGYRRCPYRSDAIYFKIPDEHVEIMAIIGKRDMRGKK